jgi:DNA-directed RNA polymerase specialized sigma24 family protein
VDVARASGEPSGAPAAGFEAFVADTEPPLRRALVAAYGADAGREATAEALGWAWAHWDRVQTMGNPGGYLWRVGRTAARRSSSRRSREAATGLTLVEGSSAETAFEPALAGALRALSPRQRAAVVLVHGHGYTLTEAAAALGCSVSSVRNHVDRALRRLRTSLGGQT